VYKGTLAVAAIFSWMPSNNYALEVTGYGDTMQVTPLDLDGEGGYVTPASDDPTQRVHVPGYGEY